MFLFNPVYKLIFSNFAGISHPQCIKILKYQIKCSTSKGMIEKKSHYNFAAIGLNNCKYTNQSMQNNQSIQNNKMCRCYKAILTIYMYYVQWNCTCIYIITCDISNSGLPAQLIHVYNMYIIMYLALFFTGKSPLGPSVECCILNI